MKVRQLFNLIIVTTLPLVLLCGSVFGQSQKTKVSTIVIDPGHGGKHPGTVYRNIMEKDITLQVAKKLGALINENLPDVKVIYTRTTDKYVDLVDRGKLANTSNADLFLSIHVDATKSTTPNGSSSWVMGIEKSQQNLDVVMRENDVVSYEEDYTAKYEGYVPGSPESYIIFNLMQYANTDLSMMFADMIQKHYRKGVTIADRGARQAPFLVLWRTAMPSVLTEIGFLSNAEDRRIITSESGQNKIAKAIFNAFSEYKAKVEGMSSPIQLPSEDAEAERRLNAQQSTSQDETSTVNSSAQTKSNNITFCVQVASSPNRVSTNSSTFKSYRGKVKERKVGKLYKYVVGETKSYEEALALQRKVRSIISGAFVVAFDGDKPIAVNDARRLVE